MDVKALCLGVLTLGDASGYEIRKMFEEGPFSHFHQASFGSIYPALSKLLDEGLVSCTVEAQDGRPDKKVYSLTTSGMEEFRRALKKTPEKDKIRSETLFMLFFADHLDDDQLENIYDNYLDEYRYYVEKIQSLDSTGLSRGRKFVRGFGLAFYQGVLKYMEENREEFLSSARGGGWRDLDSLLECADLAETLDAQKKANVGGTK